ncbi:Transposase IS116/IS110/IS902 family protein [compost metagenome]
MQKRTTKPQTAHLADLSRCTTVAVDLAKQVFQVAGEDAGGVLVYEKRIQSREAFSTLLGRLAKGATVLLETGPGAQAWARQVQAVGCQVRLLPAQRVAEHRSGAKNDRNDAQAILRAGRDTAIHAVPVKTAEALAMQAVHRVRQGYLRRRTALGNQIRGLLLEHGLAIPQGAAALSDRVSRILEDATLPLPDLLRALIADLQAEWQALEGRILMQTKRLEQSAHADKTACRLMSVRGIGPIIATALVAKQVEPERFPNARQFAAYVGLVPDQHSSGQKVRLGKMSKRGDGYLRSLLIEGAHAVLRTLKADSEEVDDRRLNRWMQRHGRKGAAVRLANRNLRIAWVLLQSDALYSRNPPVRPEAAMAE